MFNQAQESLARKPTYVVRKNQDRLNERIVGIKNLVSNQEIFVKAVQGAGMTV